MRERVEMAAAQTLSHAGHPHPLTRVHLLTASHTCDGCKTKATQGIIYRCDDCNFDLHDHCATLPDRLSAGTHPGHGQLVRAAGPERESGTGGRICDVCMEKILGSFYLCTQCEFDVHPCCSQLPTNVDAGPLHRKHNLVLSSSDRGRCAGCRFACTGWRYRCNPCGVDYHIDCLQPAVTRKESDQGKQKSPEFVNPVGPFVSLLELGNILSGGGGCCGN